MNTSQMDIKKESFTLREIKVLRLIADGLTNQEISKELHVSIETVKWYAKQIFPKLGVSNRTQAAIKADEIGLLARGESSLKPLGESRKLSNLPAQLTSYIGREKDTSKVKKLILDNRLVTLTGPGGIGKTRLTLQVASEIQSHYRDGVWLVELAPLEDAAQVMHAVAKVLAIGEREGTSLGRALKNYLSTKNMLLLIDNFEHLLSAAPFVGEILAEAPQISVLSTSRERLNVYGEIDYQVAPLELPEFQITEAGKQLRNYEALSLFIERAQASRPGYEVDDNQIRAVAKICKLLDGLPLAIELAAPLVKLFSPAQIAEKLETDLDALPSGPRDFPARQRTLRATQEWSYNLLSAEEKILFTNLGVFTGGFTLEAIQAVCADQVAGNVINIVASLVDRNLINTKEGRDGEVYFSMLETTRQLTRERLLASGDADDIFRRHAEYYLEMSERAMKEYISPMNKYWFLRIYIEQENLRNAFNWLGTKDEIQKCMRLIVALKNFWRNFGLSREGLEWADFVFEREDEVQKVLFAKGLLVAAEYCLDLYQAEKAKDLLDKALSIFKQQNNMIYIGWCYAFQSVSMLDYQYEISKAIEKGRESLEIFREEDDVEGRIYSYNLLGEMFRAAGDFKDAKSYYEQSLNLAKENGILWRESSLYANLGILAYQQGEYKEAEKLTRQCLQIFFDMNIYFGIFYDIGGLAGGALGLGNPNRAAKLLGMSSAGLESFESFHQQTDKTVVQNILDETMKVLGEKEFQDAWEEGRRMTVQEAFDYALNG